MDGRDLISTSLNPNEVLAVLTSGERSSWVRERLAAAAGGRRRGRARRRAGEARVSLIGLVGGGFDCGFLAVMTNKPRFSMLRLDLFKDQNCADLNLCVSEPPQTHHDMKISSLGEATSSSSLDEAQITLLGGWHCEALQAQHLSKLHGSSREVSKHLGRTGGGERRKKKKKKRGSKDGKTSNQSAVLTTTPAVSD
uniref:Uncharacterized protein n=1 Tax=Oryza meridionalis TaxID=40149 RepID=A0A0E0D4F4_9ORYZ